MATGQRMNFTKRSLLALGPAPAGKRDYYYDTNPESRGLCLAVTDRGAKTFCLYRKLQGVPTRVFVGAFPDLTVEQARNTAKVLLGEIAQGKNPHQDRQAERGEVTLKTFFKEYLDRHAVPYKKTWQEDEATFNRYLERWKARRLSSIRRQDIQLLHSEIGRDCGPYAANRLLALLSTLFGKARDWGYCSGENPTEGVKRFREVSRERYLQADELPRFFQSLAEESNHTIRDAILMCLLTGARRGNVQAMRWEQLRLDVEDPSWTIPDTKSGRPLTVPLVPDAVELLKARQPAIGEKSPWVFPGPGKSGHLVEVKITWQRILKRAGLSNLRMHDLRRTLGSWEAQTGASLVIIGRSLGHRTPSATMIYSRLSQDPVRQAMQTAIDSMKVAAGLSQPAEVVPLPNRRP